MKTRAICLLVLVLTSSTAFAADEKVLLREEKRPGKTSVVSLEFKAEGDLIIPQATNKDTSQRFTAQGRFAFEEKSLDVDAEATGVAQKSLRFYTQSSVESVIEKTRIVRGLREPVRIMVCEVREGRPFVFSPAGPLTVEEYELVEADAAFDSLVLGGLLPPEAIAVGDHWKPNDADVCALFNLPKLTENAVDAKLESVDASTAKFTLAGHVSGIASGAQSTRTIVGELIFDRTHSAISQMTLSHSEERDAGPLGHGLRVKATYSFRRDFDGAIVHLNDSALEELPLKSNPATEQLVFAQPDGKYHFYFQRGWFVTLSNPQALVLRLVENGDFLSECHVLTAPTVSAGTHMKPEDFRTQVQQALGNQFQQFVQEGEVPAPRGYWIYRLSVAGSSGQRPVIWNYHLIAGPQGQQLVFIFRVGADQIDEFGVRDLALVSTLEFEAPRTATNQK